MTRVLEEQFLIVDDHPVVLDGVHLLLQSIRPNAMFCMAASGSEALSMINSQNTPDWAFIDINLPDIQGLELVKLLKTNNATCKVVVLSSELDGEILYQAIAAGADGVLSKSFSKDIFELCIMTVELGTTFLSSEHASELKYYKDSLMREQQHIRENLSKRQFEVLVLLAQGHGNKDISEQMYISQSTVKSHVSSLMFLFEASNRTHCVEKARQLKII